MGQVLANRKLTCGVDAGPHTEGICGQRLQRTRKLLCVLLREDYPNIFNKRSISDHYVTLPSQFRNKILLSAGNSYIPILLYCFTFIFVDRFHFDLVFVIELKMNNYASAWPILCIPILPYGTNI